MSNLFTYRGKRYPTYLKRGNAMQYIEPIARRFCQGNGIDVGCGNWPFMDATPIDLLHSMSAYGLPNGEFDYVFSSHCLEHLVNPIGALEHWKTRIKQGGVLFLYLPHPDMTYWRPENCRKHLHLFRPADVAQMLETLGFVDVLHSERDMMWSFCVVGYNGRASPNFPDATWEERN